MSASPTEITRDIIVALIEKNTSNLGAGDGVAAAQNIAKAFEILHAKVKEKYQVE